MIKLNYLKAIFLLVLIAVFPASIGAQDTITYDGDTFSFDYPTEWFITVDEELESVIISDTEEAVSDNTSQTISIGSATGFIESFLESGDGVNAPILVGETPTHEFTKGYLLGMLYFVDSFAAAFTFTEDAEDVEVKATTLYTPVEENGYSIVGFEGLVMDLWIISVDELMVVAVGPHGTTMKQQALDVAASITFK